MPRTPSGGYVFILSKAIIIPKLSQCCVTSELTPGKPIIIEIFDMAASVISWKSSYCAWMGMTELFPSPPKKINVMGTILKH